MSKSRNLGIPNEEALGLGSQGRGFLAGHGSAFLMAGGGSLEGRVVAARHRTCSRGASRGPALASADSTARRRQVVTGLGSVRERQATFTARRQAGQQGWSPVPKITLVKTMGTGIVLGRKRQYNSGVTRLPLQQRGMEGASRWRVKSDLSCHHQTLYVLSPRPDTLNKKF